MTQETKDAIAAQLILIQKLLELGDTAAALKDLKVVNTAIRIQGL